MNKSADILEFPNIHLWDEIKELRDNDKFAHALATVKVLSDFPIAMALTHLALMLKFAIINEDEYRQLLIFYGVE